MSKLGVILTSSLSLGGVVAAYVPRSSYPRRDDTYARADDLVAQLNSKFSPGESPRLPLDRITNLAQLFNFPQPPPPSAAGCVGVSQTFTSTGTFTSGCTGTLTMEAWGMGGGVFSDYMNAGGGGAFAKTTTIAVTNGQTWLAVVPAGTIIATGRPSFICPTAVGACFSGLTSCSGVGLTTSNFVCADNGRAGTAGAGSSLGGSTAKSVGVTLFAGGKGGAAGSTTAGAGGGGAAGSDGAGADGTNSSTNHGGDGGTADNGFGGVGGTGSTGNNNTQGADNVKGGGGTGGSLRTDTIYQLQGGAPGGGSGAGVYTFPVPGTPGRVVVHSDASDVLTPVLTGGSGYSGGTVGMA